MIVKNYGILMPNFLSNHPRSFDTKEGAINTSQELRGPYTFVYHSLIGEYVECASSKWCRGCQQFGIDSGFRSRSEFDLFYARNRNSVPCSGP